MKDYIAARATKVASYMISTKSTIRQTAKVFYVSKSTVFKDTCERLQEINPVLYKEVREVIKFNGDNRYIRGGQATALKFKS